ncbi:MAG: nitronate monooxygenase [Kineosporiaceae bacterium]|nr:nitronate monooxygenase [Kineosporiaceae bacterium]MBK7621215.1 nitronate monooxygenase [Kineosporiaceae bacterium]MBK8076071.1 nitronate monooxygenase [Kineosporiaceae bacterium]
MGVAVSDWGLARAVSLTGQLGVVSGTALDVLCTRRLQHGDPGGHVRRALAAFPVPEVAQWILDAYFVEGGIAPDALYRQVPRHTIESGRRTVQLTTAANFVEVFLAKEGHDGVVGVNYLRKIELPLPSALYGAMLAGVDYVLVGAGSPAEIPELTRTLARHAPVAFSIKVQGARSSDGLGDVRFDPAQVRPDAATALAPLALPRVLAIVASTDLATALAENPDTRPSGFVVEGPSAGGHNAPPRGPRRLDPIGQPVYDDRDVVDLPTLAALGLPYWLAGSYGSPERFREALASGAAGIQVGTVFAYCDDSGFDPELVAMVRARVLAGDLQVRADWRASPTGFPFRVVELPGTLTEAAVHEARQPVCDLGALRSAFRREDGGVDYRCPAEPLRAYTRKGGREANTEGRICLCNALFASAGLGQRRPGGLIEPPLVTSGEDLSGVAALLTAARGGTVDSGEFGYTARDVVDYLLS